MLSARELVDQLLASAEGKVSIEDFEEWFGSASRNVHQQQDQDLIDSVFHLESLFSDYSGNRIGRSELLRSFEAIAVELKAEDAGQCEAAFALRPSNPRDGITKRL